MFPASLTTMNEFYTAKPFCRVKKYVLYVD